MSKYHFNNCDCDLCLAWKQGKSDERKRIDKELSKWYSKWMRKIITARCLAELKEILKISGEKDELWI